MSEFLPPPQAQKSKERNKPILFQTLVYYSAAHFLSWLHHERYRRFRAVSHVAAPPPFFFKSPRETDFCCSIIMAGTSPFPYQSPSFHSSSYLPKLEANFMKDFSCCGKTLPTLHDLLQHYEECHAQQTPQSLRTASLAAQARDNAPNGKAAMAAQALNSAQQQAHAQQQRQQLQNQSQAGQGANGVQSLGGIQLMRQQQQSGSSTPTQRGTPQPADDMDGVEDMEMDDAIGPMEMKNDSSNQANPPASSSLFGQQSRPSLNLTNTNGMTHQGLRTSQPSTPAAGGFGFQNNPTVSSVNTPTLSAQLQQNNGTFSPDTSVPGTPAELDEDFANMPMNMMGNMNMMNGGNMNFPFGFGNDLGLDLCIDEPAKRLYSPNGGIGNQRALQQQFAQFGLSQGQFGGGNDLMRQYQRQQMMAMQGLGGPSAAMMMVGEEHKPFRCPVIGCEKAYKNQNGLK
jgi:transcription factor SFP1